MKRTRLTLASAVFFLLCAFSVQSFGASCSNIADWTPDQGWWTYSVGDQRVNANKIWSCIDVSHSFREPSKDGNGTGWSYTEECGTVVPPTLFKIFASAGSGGSISPNGTVVLDSGVNQSFTINVKDNYTISDIIVNGESQGAVTSYTFNSVSADHTIEARFAASSQVTYTVTATAGSGGSISPSGSITVPDDGEIEFTITPNSGYLIQDVKVNGVSVGKVSFLEIDDIEENKTVEASFEQNATPPPPTSSIPAHALVGYWHNFDNGTNTILLNQVDSRWDVINVSFAEQHLSLPGGVAFQADDKVYSSAKGYSTQESRDNALKTHVSELLAAGKRVQISLGGANATIEMHNDEEQANFVSTMKSIIDFYGFTGLDCDIEHGIMLGSGDTDFRNPKTPAIVHLIAALREVVEHYRATTVPDFTLTMAPEVAYVYSGHDYYTGVWGAYLPVIEGVRDLLTFIHVQHYNANGITGLDGVQYNHTTKDYHVAATELLLRGFDIANTGHHFDPLREDQVGIGIPATQGAASSGYMPPADVIVSLDYLYKGTKGAGLNYTLQGGPYPNLRCVMTWSINWDVKNNDEFLDNYAPYMDALDGSSPPPATHTITASAQANGSISPNGSVSVDEGTNQSFSIAANSGYTVDYVLVDGANQGAITSYTFTSVQSNHTIEAYFKSSTTTQYTITASAGANGSISPSGGVSVNAGSDQSFTIAANSGYEIDYVSVDGASQGAVTSYTFDSVQADHTISAYFKAASSCSYPLWSATTTYSSAGNTVQWNNRKWTNQWWTLNEEPGVAGGGVWRDDGLCQ